MDETDLGQAAFAERIGVSRSALSNWLSEARPELPAEEAMIAICERFPEYGLTLDWLYRGVADAVPMRVAIRLTARLHEMDPDQAGASVLERAAPA